METLITIKPINIEEVKINKTNPTTIRKTQVSKPPKHGSKDK